jgi:hypothetical protein
VAQQEKIKSEEIDITYSYWDGSGHRRHVKMKKGDSIHRFLAKVLEGIRKDFSELRTVNVDQLMYIKEDLIIPHVNSPHVMISSTYVILFSSTIHSMTSSSIKPGGRAVLCLHSMSMTMSD